MDQKPANCLNTLKVIEVIVPAASIFFLSFPQSVLPQFATILIIPRSHTPVLPTQGVDGHRRGVSGVDGAASAGAADVAQVQELFPHVGERTAAALLASVDGNVERAVVALLEGGAASGLPEE